MCRIEPTAAISLREAAKLLPGNPSRTTLSRWTHHGVRGVKLATILIGNRRYTSRDALEHFIGATNEQSAIKQTAGDGRRPSTSQPRANGVADAPSV